MANKVRTILCVTETPLGGLTGNAVKLRGLLEVLLREGYHIDVCCWSSPGSQTIQFKHPRLRIFSVSWPRKNLTKLLWMLSLTPLQLRKFYSRHMLELIKKLQRRKKYTHVFLDGFSSVQYQPAVPANAVYIEDENMLDIYRLRGQLAKGWRKVWYRFEALRCRLYIWRFFSTIKRAWVVSPQNMVAVRTWSGALVRVIPTVVKIRRNAFNARAANLVFTGTLNWEENRQGLEWFLRFCWPIILHQKPKTQLLIIGQHVGREFLALFRRSHNLHLISSVQDLASVYTNAAVAIAPLRINSGIKMKILTYLSYGLPTVSTPMGTRGMLSQEGMVIARTPAQFSRGVVELLNDVVWRQSLSHRAQQNIRNHHSVATVRRFFKKEGIL